MIDILITDHGSVRLEHDIKFIVSEKVWRGYVAKTAKAAWDNGDSSFMFTDQMAREARLA